MQENPLSSYGKMLQGFREDNYLSKTEVASVLGVTVTAVTNWENGNRLPSPQYRKHLKRLYGMPDDADILSCLRMYSKEELVQIVMSLIDKSSRATHQGS